MASSGYLSGVARSLCYAGKKVGGKIQKIKYPNYTSSFVTSIGDSLPLSFSQAYGVFFLGCSVLLSFFFLLQSQVAILIQDRGIGRNF